MDEKGTAVAGRRAALDGQDEPKQIGWDLWSNGLIDGMS